MMKVCFKCRRPLPISSFYVHKEMGDGHLGKCKDCTKRDAREHRKGNREKVNAYDKLRELLPHRIALKKKIGKRYRESHPERNRANLTARRAIRSGKLVPQPCEACGKTKVVAHHDDYSKPLSIRWLCQSCHIQHHRGTL